jgi:hypothetical protein
MDCSIPIRQNGSWWMAAVFTHQVLSASLSRNAEALETADFALLLGKARSVHPAPRPWSWTMWK